MNSPYDRYKQYKIDTVTAYAKQFGLKTFVETGTCFGDMLIAVRDFFSELYSIELSPKLHNDACKKFYGDRAVHLFLGDSGIVLPKILPQLPTDCLFWLDAHYSGAPTARGPVDTPIMQELDAIFAVRPKSVLLIDDAVCFNGTCSYPSLGILEEYVKEKSPSSLFEVKGDIIRIHERTETA